MFHFRAIGNHLGRAYQAFLFRSPMGTAVPDIQSLRIGYFADDKLIIDRGRGG